MFHQSMFDMLSSTVLPRAAYMDARDAIKIAKDQLRNFFEGEAITNLGLEEVDFSEVDQEWRITLGFSRAWNRGALLDVTPPRQDRVYKVVHIPENEVPKVYRVTHREVAA